ARTSEARAPRVHQQLRGSMVEFVSMNSLQERHFVGNIGEVRHQIRNPCAGFTTLPEGCLRTKHLRHPFDEGEALPVKERLRTKLSVELLQLGFVVEQFQLRWCTSHVQEDDPFRRRCEVRQLVEQRAGRYRGIRCGWPKPRQGTEGHSPEPGRALLQEVPARRN